MDQLQATRAGPRHALSALPSQPIGEVETVEPDDASHLEHGKWVFALTSHVAAPAFGAPKFVGNAFPGFIEIIHALALCTGCAGG